MFNLVWTTLWCLHGGKEVGNVTLQVILIWLVPTLCGSVSARLGQCLQDNNTKETNWYRVRRLTHSPTLRQYNAYLMIFTWHNGDVLMGTVASQITSLTIVYSTVYSGADQRKHQSSASLAFVRGIHRGLVNSPHKWPVTRKMFPFDDVIMENVHFDWFNWYACAGEHF